MAACGQCGKDNPEGTVFGGYCATPLMASDPGSQSSKPAGRPIVAPQIRGGSSSAPPKPVKPEIRTPTFHTAPPPSSGGKGKGGFELLPWSELSPGQRAGRVAAAVGVLLLIFFLIRGMIRNLSGLGGTS